MSGAMDWYGNESEDEFDSTDEWLERAMEEDLRSIERSMNVFRIFFAFQPQVVLPAPPPENEEVEWEGQHLTAKVWYELDA